VLRKNGSQTQIFTQSERDHNCACNVITRSYADCTGKEPLRSTVLAPSGQAPNYNANKGNVATERLSKTWEVELSTPSVNNHAQVKRIAGYGYLAGRLYPPVVQECAPPAQDLIIQVDGGHIPPRQGPAAFEALSVVVYGSMSPFLLDRQQSIQISTTVSQHLRNILLVPLSA